MSGVKSITIRADLLSESNVSLATQGVIRKWLLESGFSPASAAGVTAVFLAGYSNVELLKIPNFGRGRLIEVRAWLASCFEQPQATCGDAGAVVASPVAGLRAVMLSEYDNRVDSPTCGKYVELRQGRFHGWGVDYEEYETGPGNFSTAIVELDDGTVMNLPARLVRFLDRGEG